MGSGSGFLNDITQVSAGNIHTCALQNNGRAVCWGAGDSGQLGKSGTSISTRPQNVLTLENLDFLPLEDMKQISAGDEHTCALKIDGGVVCWGKGGYGRLGNGSYTNRQTSQKVKGVGGIGF